MEEKERNRMEMGTGCGFVWRECNQMPQFCFIFTRSPLGFPQNCAGKIALFWFISMGENGADEEQIVVKLYNFFF